MKRRKLHTASFMVLIAMLVLGMVSCTGSNLPISACPDTGKTINSPTPAPPDSNTISDVPPSPSPDSGQSNSLLDLTYSEEQRERIASIEQNRTQGQKQQALDRLEDLIRLSNPSGIALKRELNDLWWEITIDTTNIPQEPLTDAEVRNIAAVAYLMHPMDCFFYPRSLSVQELLRPTVLWYSNGMQIPMYGRDGWEKSTPDYYPPDYDTEYGYALTEEHVNQFTRDMVGVEFLPFYDDYSYGYLTFSNGMFEIEGGDPLYDDLLVSGYRYLGDGLYYVVLDGDDTSLPGPEEGRAGIIPDFMHLVVKRSHSLWGFTVVAKLHDAYEDYSLLKEGWTLPEDMTLLVNTPHYPVQ